MWLGIVVIFGCAAIGVALVLLARLFVGRNRGDEHNAVFGLGFGAAGTLYAIIAGLLVFSAFSSFESAEKAVAEEAGNLVTMTYDVHEFPQPQRDQAHAAILSYTRSVVDDE